MKKPLQILCVCLLMTLVFTGCTASEPDTTVTTSPTTINPVLETIQTCSTVSSAPPINPAQQSPIPPPSETDWISGDPDASMTIIVYSDFQ